MNESTGAGGWSVWFVVAFWSLLASCGSPASEQPSGLESRAGIGKSEDRTGAAQPRSVYTGQDVPQSVTATSSFGTTRQAYEAPSSLPSNIPAAVTKDLASPDARDRYRALDHWEAIDSNAPLDPVFQAMEDEDPAVRAKATTIVEQRWAMEQARKKG